MAEETVSHAAFSDPRAFVVPHDRPGPGLPLDKLFTTQSEDGPTFIHVGSTCTDEQLRQAWESRRRFTGLTFEQLIDARDGRVECSEVHHG